MSAESPKLGITEAEVRESARHIEESGDSDLFTSIIFMQMVREQRGLHELIELFELRGGINDVELLRLGAAWAFDQIPQRHRGKPLTTDELTIFKNNLLVRKRDKKIVLLGLPGFIDKLGEDSVAFADWLSTAVEGLGTDKERKDFMLGAVLVATPFLMRVEAEVLEKKFG